MISSRQGSPAAPAAIGSDARPVPGPDDGWRRSARAALRHWCRVDARDVGRIPLTGGVLIAANHTSHADAPALGLAVAHRSISFLGTDDLLEVPFIGRLLPGLGMVPVRRGAADLEAMEIVRDLLATGHAVVVFPEGTRSRSGAVHRPRSGVARLAAAAGVPVVPAGVQGAADWWPIDGRPRLRGGSVRIRIGAPIAAPGPSPADRRAFASRLHGDLVALSGAPRADGFAQVPINIDHGVAP